MVQKMVITALITILEQIIARVTPDMAMTLLISLFKTIEDFVKKTETPLDDKLVLPMATATREALERARDGGACEAPPPSPSAP